MMKKITFLAAVFLMLGLVSCGNDDDAVPQDLIVGEWRLVNYFEDNETDLVGECESQSTLEFDVNGTFTSTEFWENDLGECENDEPYSENWQYVGDNMYEFTEDNSSYTVKILFSSNDNTLTTYTEEGGVTYGANYVRID